MAQSTRQGPLKNLELKVILLILFSIVSLSIAFHFMLYNLYYSLTISNLEEHASTVYKYVNEIVTEDSFSSLNTIDDEQKEIYITAQKELDTIRRIANIRYLYTAKKNPAGEYIYILDGLDTKAADFRHIGDPIEKEIIPKLDKVLHGGTVMGDKIMLTEWGIVYVNYFPVKNSSNEIIGAIGVEFDGEKLYASFSRVRLLASAVAVLLAAFFIYVAIVILKKVVNNAENSLQKNDRLLVQAKEEALRNSNAKSEFLSRVSHEIRTPLNAIIGMTSIAESTNDIKMLKYCISIINSSSEHLLSLINDVLDLAKIEAGKIELQYERINLEKILMRVCGLICDRIRKNKQHFSISLDKHLATDYISNELRLAQILTNLLANAVKFTPESGSISLSVTEKRREEKFSTLRFEIIDTGIGISPEQAGKIFNTFSQANANIAKQFGGTGLGLSIAKSLVERMGGRIWVESETGKGSTFIFEIQIERASPDHPAVITDDINPASLKVLLASSDKELTGHFTEIFNRAKIKADLAGTGSEALQLMNDLSDAGRGYDMIFIDYDLPDMNGAGVTEMLNSNTDRNTIVMITHINMLGAIEHDISRLGVRRFISKPLLYASIIETINSLIGSNPQKQTLPAVQSGMLPDLSGVTALLVEDMEINRQIITVMLSPTHINIEAAENGLLAFEKIKAEPDRYDIILMDIQMPVMDGYEATQAIRALDSQWAKSIPIIAITANAFKEDIDKSIAKGMNDHIAKPVNKNVIMDTIVRYTLNIQKNSVSSI